MTTREQKPAEKRRRLIRRAERLYAKLAELVYAESMSCEARQYAEQLDTMISNSELFDIAAIDSSIYGTEIRAVIAEARQDWRLAAKLRRKKIRLLLRLRKTANAKISAQELVPSAYLGACYTDLAIVLRNQQELEGAREAIRRARRLDRSLRVSLANLPRPRLNTTAPRKIDTRKRNKSRTRLGMR
jgi:hypothetical protein